MRTALSPSARRNGIGQFVTMPAPVKGLNFRDGITALKATDALILDNYFPEASYCRLRGGFEAHVTGFAAAVETVMEYASPTARALFAASGTAIYDATTAGAVGAAVVASLTNARWQHAMFTTSAGDFLVAVNGADGVRTYDGSAWATQVITVATAADLADVAVWKGRLWFTENSSNKVWYLASGAIAGAAVAFDLGPVFKLGGAVAFITPLSFTSGSTVDDGICFISTEGEVALYVGTDPASATTFGLRGVYRIPSPLPGRRGYARFNGDCLVMTDAGLVSLLTSARLDETQQQNSSVSERIDPELARQAAVGAQEFGWQVFAYPRGTALMVNAPQGAGEYHQWTMNAITTAWCRYTGMNPLCWALFDGAPYFGGATAVYAFDIGRLDNGAAIRGALKGAFSSLGSHGLKRVTMLRPFLTTNSQFTPSIGLDVDFSDIEPTDVGASPVVAAALWDVALWDAALWGGGSLVSREWSSAAGIGTWFAPRFSTATRGVEITINAFDLVYEPATSRAL